MKAVISLGVFTLIFIIVAVPTYAIAYISGAVDPRHYLKGLLWCFLGLSGFLILGGIIEAGKKDDEDSR